MIVNSWRFQHVLWQSAYRSLAALQAQVAFQQLDVKTLLFHHWVMRFYNVFICLVLLWKYKSGRLRIKDAAGVKNFHPHLQQAIWPYHIGWATPLKNMSSSVGMMTFPYGNIKNVPNHQPDDISIKIYKICSRMHPAIWPSLCNHFFFPRQVSHCGLCPFCPWWYLQNHHHAARVSSVLPVPCCRRRHGSNGSGGTMVLGVLEMSCKG